MTKVRGIASCLSKPVENLLMNLGISDRQIQSTVLADNTIDWKRFETVLNDGQDDGQSDLNYEKVIPFLAPLINDSYLTFKQFLSFSSQTFYANCHWLRSLRDELFLALRFLEREEPSKIILAGLIVTAVLERSLGNLLLLKRHHVPPLLKDLLAVPELAQLIGHTAVKLLQVIIGPPSSLNIRNLLWHGFMSPGELSSRYIYFLLSIINSIGNHLRCQSLVEEMIPERPLTKYVDDEKFVGLFPELNQTDILDIRKVIECSPVIFRACLPLWDLVLELYTDGRWGFCSVLLASVMESYLRVIYATVNDIEVRLLTAQSFELYTTYSEILSEHLVDSTDINQFINVFKLSHIEMMMDVLFNPEGLRFRDRMSHGQVDLLNLPRSVANFFLCVNVSLLLHVEELMHKTPSVYSQHIQQIYDISVEYKSIFHINSYLKKCLKTIYERLEHWQNKWPSGIEQLLINDINVRIHDIHVPTMFRPPTELSFVVLLRQISEVTLMSIEEVLKEQTDKLALLNKRELRSRQRDNFTKLQLNNSIMFSGMTSNLTLIVDLFINVLEHEELTQDKLMVKKLKKVLKFSQNFLKYVRENQWESCEKLAISLIELSKSILNSNKE